MFDNLVLILLGFMVLVMFVAVAITQSVISRKKDMVIEEPEEEKVFVELGFESEDEQDVAPEEPVQDTVDLDVEPTYDSWVEEKPMETGEVFFEASEPVTIEAQEAVRDEPQMRPMFEASYESSGPVVIETPDLIIIDDYEIVSEPEENLVNDQAQETELTVVETEELVMEPEEVVETVAETVVEPLVEIEEPVPDDMLELEAPPVNEPQEVSSETIDATPMPRQLRNERKPIIDESDPDLNMDMGVKTCSHCDSEVPNTIYCINCGKSLEG